MKKYDPNILFAAVMMLLAMTAASCSEDTYTGGTSGTDAVRIATATVGTQTRAAASESGFANGDAFRLSTSADGTDAATYTLGADGWNSATPLLWGSTFPVTFYAAYPATATYNSFTLPTDQSNGTAEANYMTESVEVQDKTALSLAFAHKTAQVIVKITERATGNEGALTDAVIRSPHSAYANAAVTGNAVDITPQTSSSTEADEEARYTALVLPGTADGFNLFSVKVDGKEATFTTDVAFEENHIYEYTLTIGKERVTLAGFSVKDWTTKDLTASMTPQWDGTAADSYAGGKGTKDDPYQIANAAQLAYLGTDLKGGMPHGQYFKLIADIDLAGANWTPIGIETSFTGHFDGGGHTIKNMSINMSELTTQYYGYLCGLFAQIYAGMQNASVRNLTVENVNIQAATSENAIKLGVIVGEINTSPSGGICNIDNCHVKNANISFVSEGDQNLSIGGIIGKSIGNDYLHPTTISRCTVEGLTTTVTGKTLYAGGLCGSMEGGVVQIFASLATGTLNGTYTNGLVGCLWRGRLIASGSYADCTLNGESSAAITSLSKTSGAKQIIWDYLALRGADVLRSGEEPSTSNYDYKEEECYLFNDPSEVYGIVANEANTTTFTVDGTTYNVKDCWQDNGNALPTLKVNKDGTINE